VDLGQHTDRERYFASFEEKRKVSSSETVKVFHLLCFSIQFLTKISKIITLKALLAEWMASLILMVQ
jgi:hypothetical protein